MNTVDHLCSAFIRRVLLRMKELGLSRSALAKRMHVSRPYVTALMTRDCNFSFQTAARLAKALQMDFMPELCLQPRSSAAQGDLEPGDFGQAPAPLISGSAGARPKGISPKGDLTP